MVSKKEAKVKPDPVATKGKSVATAVIRPPKKQVPLIETMTCDKEWRIKNGIQEG